MVNSKTGGRATADQRMAAFLAAERPYLADGGLEKVMIYHEGFDLPSFAAFTLFESPQGGAALEHYFTRYIDLSILSGTCYVLDTATWRAKALWMEQMGLSQTDLVCVNQVATAFARGLQARPCRSWSTAWSASRASDTPSGRPLSRPRRSLCTERKWHNWPPAGWIWSLW